MSASPLNGWSWTAQHTPAWGKVCLDLGARARVWVQVSDPDRVVGADAPDLAAMARLSAVTGGGYARDVLASHPLGAVLDAKDLPVLDGSWQRLVQVAAIDQHCPLELDEALLVIDKAVAWSSVGFPKKGAALAGLAQHLICDLYAAAHAGWLPVAAAALIGEAVEVVKSGPDPDPETIQRLDAITARAGAYQSLSMDEVHEWLAGHGELTPMSRLAGQPLVAAHLGGFEHHGSADLPVVLLDSRLLPARILPWREATWAGINLHIHDADLQVDVQLRAGVYPTSVEARALRLVLTETTTGQHLASVPLTYPDDQHSAPQTDLDDVDTGVYLHARLTAPTPGWGQCALSLTTTPDDAFVVVDPASQVRIRLERLMLASWSHHRMAAATGDTAHTSVARDFRDAATRLGNTIPAGTDLSAGTGADLDAVMDRLDWPPPPPDPLAARPLLAELLYGTDLDELHTQVLQLELA